MKIAMIAEHVGPHVAELSAALARRRHDVTVYTRRDDPDSPEQLPTALGYTVVHVPAGTTRGAVGG